ARRRRVAPGAGRRRRAGRWARGEGRGGLEQHAGPARAALWRTGLDRVIAARRPRHARGDSDSPVKLLIVDDEPLAREGLRREVSRLPGITVVGECGTRADAVDVIVERRPD